MWTFLAALIALISSGAVWLNKVDVPLPPPGQYHTIRNIDPASVDLTWPAMEGPYAPNEVLRKAHRLFDNVIQSSETVAVSPGGNLTLLDKYGYVYEAEPASKVPNAVFPNEWALDLPALDYLGPGRPLGFHYDAQGNLIVCDSLKGLIMREAGTGRLVVLTSRVSPDDPTAPGSPLAYTNDLDIARGEGGAIYFSDSQAVPVGLSPDQGPFYDTFRGFMQGLYTGVPSGRLLRYDPASRRTEVLASGIFFANGVALSADESFVTVVETTRRRVLRHWLKGPKAGTTDVLIERLPGFPDGISLASDGNFWVALVVPMNKLPVVLQYKLVRVILAYLPPWARPPLPKWGGVLKISPTGEPLQLLMDPDGSKIAYVSSIVEHGGRLYFGNVKENYGDALLPTCASPGHQLPLLHKLYGGVRRVVGLDLSRGMVDLALREIEAYEREQRLQGGGSVAGLEAVVTDASCLNALAPAAAVF
ncbi:hypothetical protein HYH03_014827 [Edaphochlamys debaryana]|uniref:Strictosidine synthase conserved region domain-containing protein n=1 Tax=Edaphochlamys debaryana TaxID=47281 RepID=A0A835XMD7_9CHLO|nr:hypothetical protein HYH03_014827 [Edaphochlamys debaryana]|eukprot:KAG2486526.1 hypothetical protein HYH03_014827 [Edaphochlamys debaryana]